MLRSRKLEFSITQCSNWIMPYIHLLIVSSLTETHEINFPNIYQRSKTCHWPTEGLFTKALSPYPVCWVLVLSGSRFGCLLQLTQHVLSQTLSVYDWVNKTAISSVTEPKCMCHPCHILSSKQSNFYSANIPGFVTWHFTFFKPLILRWVLWYKYTAWRVTSHKQQRAAQ